MKQINSLDYLRGIKEIFKERKRETRVKSIFEKINYNDKNVKT